MFGANNLKSEINVTEISVECPVKACKKTVPRQRGTFHRSEKFLCPEHGIYISPSTFEYDKPTDNLLWKNENDLDLLRRISAVKRESRIARDNSEDAVTWNVFRFLEKEKLLSNCLLLISKNEALNPKVMYWSYSQSEQSVWSQLVEAREEFELKPDKGSEPDVIIISDKTLFVIEAKLNANNNTMSTSRDPLVKEKYISGGCGWYQSSFKSDFETVAITERKYELLRFWLLGSWMAKQKDLKFVLINLVPSEKEKDIESRFKKHIKEDTNKTFQRLTWERIYSFIREAENPQKESILEYFENKTRGYNQERKLQKAFSV